MKNYRILFIVFGLVLLGAGCFNSSEEIKTNKPVDIDRDAILHNARVNGLIMNETEVAEMQNQDVRNFDNQAISVSDIESFFGKNVVGWKSAALADVTGGGSYGLAHSTFKDGVHTLISDMGSLPKLDNNYFYEGWIVRRGSDLSVISTGKAELIDDKLVNVYKSSTNLTDHDFYVLTLEPDDDNPAPAEHILEGAFN